MSDNIKVVIKVRPLIKRELEDNLRELWTVCEESACIYPSDQQRDGDNTFVFDHIFDCKSQTKDVYHIVARPIVESAVDGINGTIFAYGQTSSGKTYTMMGDQDSPGVIPLAVQNIFAKIESMADRDFLLRVSYIEIYNEKIRDLLDINSIDLKIHEDYNGQLYVKAKEEVTSTPEEVLELMKKGNRSRAVGETQMNERSSRSHTIFYIIIESRRHVSLGSEDDDSVNVSQLNLVDLAGSERAGQTGATKQRLREGGHINKSLSSLGLVIRQLSDPNRGPNTFISFRDSKLTLFLRNSLGGNSKTGIICAVTPAVLDETQSTFMFAMSAKVIQNIPKVNAVISDATLIKKLTRNMAKLQGELESKKHLEDDNKKLQEELSKVRNMILMGTTEDACSKAQKAAALRRRTWCAPPSSLPSIPEFNIPQTPLVDNKGVDTISLMTNTAQWRDVKARASSDSISSIQSRRIQEDVDVIEIDDTPDASPRVSQSNMGTTTPPVCSPKHKCYNVQQTPPCILKYRAHHAEKEYKELQEMTSLEKMYAPELVELLNNIKKLRQENEISKFEVETQKKIFASCQEEMKELKNNLEMVTAERNAHIKKQKKLLEEIEVCRNKNVDLQYEIENLTKRSQNREKELLASLKEARESQVKSRASLIPQFLNMSKDVTLVSGDLDCSQDKVIPFPSNDNATNSNGLITQLQENLKAASEQIEFSKNDLERKISRIQELESQLVNGENLNSHDDLSNEAHLEITVLKTRISELDELIQNKDAAHCVNMEYSKSEVESLTQTVKDMEQKNSFLIDELTQCREQIVKNTKDLTDSRENLAQLSDKILDHKEKVASFEEKTLSLLQDMKTKDSQIISLEDQVAALNNYQSSQEFELKDDNIKTLSISVSHLEEQIKKLSHQHSEALINKDNLISDLKVQVVSLQTDINNSKDTLTCYTVKCLKLECDLKTLESKKIEDVNYIQQKLSEASIHNEKLSVQNVELQNKCDHLNKDLSQNITNKDHFIKSLTDTNNNLNQLVGQKDCEVQENVTKLNQMSHDLENVLREKQLIEEENKNICDDFEKCKKECKEHIIELAKLKQDIQLKCDLIADLNNVIKTCQDDLSLSSNHLSENTMSIGTLQAEVVSLSEQLTALKLSVIAKDKQLEEVELSKNILTENVSNIIKEIVTLTNCLINKNFSSLVLYTDCRELDTLAQEVSNLANNTLALGCEDSLLENKENVSFRIEKTPLRSKFNASFNSASLLDSYQTLKSPKCASPQTKTKSDIVKDVIDTIENAIDNVDPRNLCNSSSPHSAEFVSIINKIMRFKTCINKSSEENESLKCKVSDLECDLSKLKESLTLLCNGFEKINSNVTTIKSDGDLLHKMQEQAEMINSYIHTYNLNMELVATNHHPCQSQFVPGDDIESSIHGTDVVMFNGSDVNDFLDFLQTTLLNFFARYNLKQEAANFDGVNLADASLGTNMKIASLKFLCVNLFCEMENLINQQNYKIISVESECNALKADKEKAESEIHNLCEESEILFNKILNAKNENSISDAERCLKNSILNATEHYHNNLHSTFLNALSFIKEHLVVLKAYLQNCNLSQQEIVDIYCNITTPGLEIVETTLTECSQRVVETRVPRPRHALFDLQSDQPGTVDRSMCTDVFTSDLESLTTDYNIKCLENKRLSNKLSMFESLKQNHDELVIERDSLSTQLMDSLEDLDNMKDMCTELKNKLASCACSGASISQCSDYIISKILHMKEDYLAVSTDLLDLLKIYSDESDNKLNSLQEEIQILKTNSSSLQIEINTSKMELQDKDLMYAECMKTLQADLTSKSEKVLELETNLETHKCEVVQLREKLAEQSKHINDNKVASEEMENELVILKKKVEVNDIACNTTQNNLRLCQSEKTQLMNHINVLESNVKELTDTKVHLVQMCDDYKGTIMELEIKLEHLSTEKVQLCETENEEKDHLSSKIIALQNQITELELSQSQVSEKVSDLENNIKYLVEEKTQLLNSLIEKDVCCKSLEEQLESKAAEIINLEVCKLDKVSQIANIVSEKLDLLNEVKGLDTKLTLSEDCVLTLERNIKILSIENDSLLDANNELKEQNKEASSSLRDLTLAHETLTEELKAKQSHIQHLSEEIENLKKYVSNEEMLLQTMSADLKEKCNDLATLREEITTYISDQRKLKEENLSLISINKNFDQMVREKEKEINEKTLQVSQLKSNYSSYASLDLENEKLKQEMVRKDEKINDLDKELNCVNHRVSEATNRLVEVDTLKSHNNVLETRVSDLQSELSCLLRSSSKLRSEHLHLKRQSLHDLHRSLSSTNDDCNDVSMEDCTNDNKMNAQIVQELKNRCSLLEEKCNQINLLYSETLGKLSKKTEEHNTDVRTLAELQVKYETVIGKLERKPSTVSCDVSTNTSNNRPEDNCALMDMFVDKLTHNHLKEKYTKLQKMNDELRAKYRDQMAEMRRLQHSLQNNTLQKLLPSNEEQNFEKLHKKLEQNETELKILREQFVMKQKEYGELEEKYKEMDTEYDQCVGLYQDAMKSYNEISSEKCLIEANLKNLEQEINDLKRTSPGRDSRKKRLSMQDFNRGLSTSTTESATNTSHNSSWPPAPYQPCNDCERNKMNLEQLKIRYKEISIKLNTPSVLMMPNALPSAIGSGIVQNQQLSDCLMENQMLKEKVTKYRQVIREYKSSRLGS